MNPVRNDDHSPPLVLTGVDGGNPVAFLAAIGTLRALSLACPEGNVKMAWTAHAGAWRPVLFASVPLGEADLVNLLDERLRRMAGHPALALADDLNVDPHTFRAFAEAAKAAAAKADGADARIAADFAAAFGCDVLTTEDGMIQDTALRTMSGAGHQHFLAFMRAIVKQTGPQHLRKTLFSRWAYDDAVTNQTLRWDPADDSRYALRWRDPSGDPARKKGGGMLGANRLAIEGLPLVTCAPVGPTLRTTGFTGSAARSTFWTWPIWTCPVGLDVCRSLLAHASVVSDSPGHHDELRAMGIVAAFRSQRITVGKFRNFA
ncbi:MAG: hypothetical protein H0W08_19075, partial [Acidobacteria bacterium]|nr:hypothetical protein [Acidobacteriota bacterium]